MRTFRIYSLCACNCHAQSLSCVQLFCDPMDCSLPGSSVYGIPQAKILEWVAISSSRGSSQPRDQIHVSWGSCIVGGFSSAEPPGNPQGIWLSYMKEKKVIVIMGIYSGSSVLGRSAYETWGSSCLNDLCLQIPLQVFTYRKVNKHSPLYCVSKDGHIISYPSYFLSPILLRHAHINK